MNKANPSTLAVQDVNGLTRKKCLKLRWSTYRSPAVNVVSKLPIRSRSVPPAAHALSPVAASQSNLRRYTLLYSGQMLSCWPCGMSRANPHRSPEDVHNASSKPHPKSHFIFSAGHVIQASRAFKTIINNIEGSISLCIFGYSLRKPSTSDHCVKQTCTIGDRDGKTSGR
jgi:hypothetical protein